MKMNSRKMRKKYRLTTSLVAVATLLAGAFAADAQTLKVGDPAPALQVGRWVQGEPVTEFARDKVYIVEFWATWCEPCIASMPHLNELANKFEDKGLVVIGQNVFERNEKLVESFRDKVSYRIALDDKFKTPEGAMAETWMAAAGQTGIPCSFLVGKDGRIAWIGHPRALKEDMIEEVLAGTFATSKWNDSQNNDLSGKQKEVEAKISKLTQLQQQFGEQLQQKKIDQAESTVSKITNLLTDVMSKEEIDAIKSEMQAMILMSKGDTNGAVEVAK